ncbi:MAG: hypothetical protein ACRDPY_25880 [Streptosporangiaceae bacterium]
MSVHPALTAAPGSRDLLAAIGAGRRGTHLMTAATAGTPAAVLTLTPAFPLALSGLAQPSLMDTRETNNAVGARTGPAVPGPDRSGRWLRTAAPRLCALAAAAAAVSFAAQYRMVDAARKLPAIAALEAAIPDAAALVFACLGVALALRGRRAIRARMLNVASVGASVFMNAIAAAPGWRNLAI